MATPASPSVTEARASELAGILRGIAHPLRLRIVALLCGQPHTVTELCDTLGARQSLVSQHLSPLRLLGLVTVDRAGGCATYSLGEPRLRALMDCLTACRRG